MLSESGDGIWIQGGDDDAVDSGSDGEEEGVEQDHISESGEEGSEGGDLSDEDEDEDEELNGVSLGGRFGALALEDAGAESTEEE